MPTRTGNFIRLLASATIGLAVTGRSTGASLTWGLGLLGAGALAVGFDRSRRQRNQH